MNRHLLPALAILLIASALPAQVGPAAMPPQAQASPATVPSPAEEASTPSLPSIPGLPTLPGMPQIPGQASPAPAPAPAPAPEATPTELPASPDSAELAAATNAPDPSGDATTPPGPGSAGTPADTKKIDFLQRSNLVLSKLLESDRPVDPFGMVMDPANAKEAPLFADQYNEIEDAPALNNSSLKSALLTLPITGVYPQRDLIVIGARSFHLGDQFGMKLQELTIRLRFEGVRGTDIFFKDMETREVTSIPFNARPAEFEPLRKGSSAPLGAGIVPMDGLFIVN